MNRIEFRIFKKFLALLAATIILFVCLVSCGRLYEFSSNFDSFFNSVNQYEHFDVNLLEAKYLDKIYITPNISYVYEEEYKIIKFTFEDTEVDYQLEEGFSLNPYENISRIFNKGNYLYFAINNDDTTKVIEYAYLTDETSVLYESDIEIGTVTYLFNNYDNKLYYVMTNNNETKLYDVESDFKLEYSFKYSYQLVLISKFDKENNILCNIHDYGLNTNHGNFLYANGWIMYNVSFEKYRSNSINGYISTTFYEYEEENRHVNSIKIESDLDIFNSNYVCYGDLIYYTVYTKRNVNKKEKYTCLVKYDTKTYKFYTCLLDINDCVYSLEVFDNKLLLKTSGNNTMGDYYIEL